MHPALHRAFEFLIHHGLAVLFGWVLVEQLGVPIPAMPLLLAAGALFRRGDFYFFPPPLFSGLRAFASRPFLVLLSRHTGSKILRLLFRGFPGPDPPRA